ncbi:hypothetical protein ACTAQI_06055 [Pseudarthrobacter sp. alpha12b]
MVDSRDVALVFVDTWLVDAIALNYDSWAPIRPKELLQAFMDLVPGRRTLLRACLHDR